MPCAGQRRTSFQRRAERVDSKMTLGKVAMRRRVDGRRGKSAAAGLLLTRIDDGGWLDSRGRARQREQRRCAEPVSR